MLTQQGWPSSEEGISSLSEYSAAGFNEKGRNKMNSARCITDNLKSSLFFAVKNANKPVRQRERMFCFCFRGSSASSQSVRAASAAAEPQRDLHLRV